MRESPSRELVRIVREIQFDPQVRKLIDIHLIKSASDMINEWAIREYRAIASEIHSLLDDEDIKVGSEFIAKLHSKALSFQDELGALGELKKPPPADLEWDYLIRKLNGLKVCKSLASFLRQGPLHASDVFVLKSRLHQVKLSCPEEKELIRIAEAKLVEISSNLN
jgi:hypothetical protein